MPPDEACILQLRMRRGKTFACKIIDAVWYISGLESGMSSSAVFSHFRQYWVLLKETAKDWMEHDSPRLGAALAFYTVFAIAPLSVILLAIAGLVLGEDAARRQVFDELQRLIGQQGGQALESVAVASRKSGDGWWATLVALGTLFLGATGVFAQLQDSLNTVWNLRRKPGRQVSRFVKARLISFAMVLGIGFILLVSLVINAGLAALGKYLSGL
ncbi:MAG TPA: YihY/virulence factor BrkB family protein, partial [Verrucomicrobiae bacterium]|nr:YihY/virulence factor BrkB family protein [Verrucomicrobiae bacterium]